MPRVAEVKYGDIVFSGREYGVRADGSTDDTDAYESLFQEVSLYGTAAGNFDGVIEWANGPSVISRPLVYAGAGGHSVRFRGEGAGSRSSNAGPTLIWSGANYPTMLILYGANQTVVEGVNLNGAAGGGLVNCIHVCADNTINYPTGYTTLVDSVTAGAGVVATPVVMTGIEVGAALGIGVGTANFEVVYVTAKDAMTITATFHKSHAAGEKVGGGAVSSGVQFSGVRCIVPTGDASAGILIGNELSVTPQVSETKTEDCAFVGQGAAGGAYTGLRYIRGGNIKNHLNINLKCSGFKYGVAAEEMSGHLTIVKAAFGSNTVSHMLLNSGHLSASGVEAEGNLGERFLIGAAGANPHSAVILDSSYESSAPADDYVIDFQGSLTLIGSKFVNRRTGSSVAKIRGGSLSDSSGSIVNPSSIQSFGNFYSNAGDLTQVFFDGSNNALRFNDFAVGRRSRFASIGDYGDGGQLQNVFGHLSVMHGAPSIEHLSAGVAALAIGGVGQNFSSFTAPYTAFQIDGLTQDLTICSIPPRSKITGVIADTTVAFAGPAGTLNLRFGTTTGGQELLLDHDVKSGTTTKGLADADLGASITRAAAVFGGYLPSWSSATNLKARLTSSSGVLNGLNAGSVTFYVTLAPLHPGTP